MGKPAQKQQAEESLKLYAEYAQLAQRTGDQGLMHRMAKRYWAWTRRKRQLAQADSAAKAEF